MKNTELNKILKSLSATLALFEDKKDELCDVAAILSEKYLADEEVKKLQELALKIHSVYDLFSNEIGRLDNLVE
jgi:hypothetical protein